MTMKEKELIRTETFHSLWGIMCSNQNKAEKKRHFIYKRSKQKYTNLKNGVMVRLPSGKVIQVTIDSILDRNTTSYHSPEWGFPKGRKNKLETNMECALREFTEETSIDHNNIEVLFDNPIVEEYKGSNGAIFCNKYFLAHLKFPCNDTLLITQTSDYIEKHGSVIQNIEIGCVQWLDYYQAIDNIREYHQKTKDLLYDVHHYLLSAYNMTSFISNPFGVPNIIPYVQLSNDLVQS
jgi:8-oxo-dGTP pyrophosphatase MutT (NUDIX family)